MLQTACSPEELAHAGMEVERRAVVRHVCNREIVYYPFLTRLRLWARVRDISVKGIGLVVDTPIDPGTLLQIEMKTMNPGISRTLLASVVHATEQEDGSWLVGCKFLTQPTEEQVLSML